MAQYRRETNNHCPLCRFLFSTASEKTRICLFRHSYIWRLQDFMTKNNEEYGNLGFEGNEVSLLSVGEGGATVRPGPKCIKHFMSTVIHFHPHITYLHIGENKFCSTHHDHPSLIASRISDLVRRLWILVKFLPVLQVLCFVFCYRSLKQCGPTFWPTVTKKAVYNQSMNNITLQWETFFKIFKTIMNHKA